jgi:alpha-N-acetylglucosamine transferase
MQNIFMGEIKSFRDLMNELSWCIEPHTMFHEVSLDKWDVGGMSITPNKITYKNAHWVMYPHVYDAFLAFVDLIEKG